MFVLFLVVTVPDVTRRGRSGKPRGAAFILYVAVYAMPTVVSFLALPGWGTVRAILAGLV